MTNLEQLLDRVVKATGADREIDADIALLAGWIELPGDNWLGPDASICVPAYTSSVDAAIAFIERVLPGWQINMHHYGEGARIAEASIGNRSVATPVNAVTPALALVAAALSALIVKEKAGE